ncbi:MAG: RNB domain-containing ribonuclease, partial [Pseudomonadota bacterium]
VVGLSVGFMAERYAKILVSAQGSYAADLFRSDKVLALDSGNYPAGTIVQYTTNHNAAVVTAVVASENSALAVIWNALSENGIDPEFPPQVSEEVGNIVRAPGIDQADLADLTHLPFITIDNVDSRDLDQAMHIGVSDDEFVLHYALADAAHFVRPGSALFAEALQRGASFYVPGFAVPMLPRELSEDLVSLNEGVTRRALVFVMRFDQLGNVLDTSVQQARIVSAAKLSYQGVEEYYRTGELSDLAGRPFTPTLDYLREFGRLRIEQARRRNVVEYDRSSVEISLSNDGETFQLIDTERLMVEKYNEQVSLVCNGEGARLLSEAGLTSLVQAVYRVHEAPDAERLSKFSRLLKGLIKRYQLDPKMWVWRWRDGRYGPKENLSDYLQRLKDNHADKHLLAAVQRHALMLSPASRFTAVAGGHYSLKLDQYARFSSPMREIAGIFTHREYLQISGQVPDTVLDDQIFQEKVIDAANRSKEKQKRLNKAVMKKAIDQLFEHQLDLPSQQQVRFTGTVMSLRSTRVYVRLDQTSISVKIYLRELSKHTGQDYHLDRSTAFIECADNVVFTLGQRITLQVHGYTEDKQRWHLLPVVGDN